MMFAAHYKFGVWSWRIDNLNVVLTLKAPWNVPKAAGMFSESSGYYTRRVPLGFGWRLIIR